MEPLDLFTIWLTFFSICFTFLPLFVVMDWHKRGTAEGFSSLSYVLPLLMMCCWFKHGIITQDKTNMFLNGVNLFFFSFYIAAFWFYQPKRKYLYGQLSAVGLMVAAIFQYVNKTPEEKQADLMGGIAAFTQIASMAGGVYDLRRAIQLKTTEYIPAQIQFGFFALTLQWTIFGFIVGNPYMMIANAAGLALNIATLSLYIIYPPKTWKVPIFGVGGGKELSDGEKKEK
uniref:Sugar transporter SWEET n=2 Tax=Meloidogyne TaxID=189290 RepID=A0A6V7U6V0_MELEN|nr:unnamed protein product [Meloidogyne enterolobii]